jgi:hypothetical protein
MRSSAIDGAERRARVLTVHRSLGRRREDGAGAQDEERRHEGEQSRDAHGCPPRQQGQRHVRGVRFWRKNAICWDFQREKCRFSGWNDRKSDIREE